MKSHWIKVFHPFYCEWFLFTGRVAKGRPADDRLPEVTKMKGQAKDYTVDEAIAEEAKLKADYPEWTFKRVLKY